MADNSLVKLVRESGSISDLIAPPVPGWESFLQKRVDQNGVSKMDLFPMQEGDWLRVDESYDAQIALKSKILKEHSDVACRLLDEAEEASQKLLIKVASFLSRKYCSRFSFNDVMFGDSETGRQLQIEGLSGLEALKTTGLIAQEDFVLMKTDDGPPICSGACLCFPSHWEIGDKIGKTMSEVHSPVSGLNNMIGGQIDKFLTGLRSWKSMERTSGTITSYDVLPFFGSLSSQLTRAEGTDMDDPGGFKPENLTLKNERQTFVRIEDTGYMAFGIKVYMSSFKDLPPNVAAHLHGMLLGTPEKFIKDYKNWSEFKFERVLQYLAHKS